MKLHNGWRGLILIALGLTYFISPTIPAVALVLFGGALFNGYAFGRLN